MKNRKLALLVLFIMLFSIFLISSGYSQGEDKGSITIRFAHCASDKSITNLAALFLKEDVEKKSNGRIKIEIFPNGVLGGDRELIEAMQRGENGLNITSTAPIVNFEPKLAVFDIPFLFPSMGTPEKTMKAVYYIYDSKPAQELLTTLESSGIIGIDYMGYGFRELTANKPIQKLEDLKGLKVRTMENKYHLALWEALGANPTPMSFNELYTALEQGTVDAQENPYELIYTMKFYEVQDYIINTDHINNTVIFEMSKKVYDSVPDDLKPILDESLRATVVWERETILNTISERVKQLEQAGAKIINLSSEEKQRFVDAAKTVEDDIASEIGWEIVDAMKKVAEEAKEVIK